MPDFFYSITYTRLLLPVLEQDLPLRIWELICLKQERLRPPGAVLQLEVILTEEIRKYEFDLMARNLPSRARVLAHSKLHLFLGDTGQLELLCVPARSMSQLVEAQAVESVRIGIDVRVKVDGVRSRKCRISLGNFCTVRKTDGFPRCPLEGDYLGLANQNIMILEPLGIRYCSLVKCPLCRRVSLTNYPFSLIIPYSPLSIYLRLLSEYRQSPASRQARTRASLQD